MVSQHAQKLGSGAGKLWRSFISLGRQREQEYRASIDALNLFFGAIVGVNFASLQDLPADDYALLLFITASLIAFILVVSNTRRRIMSALQLIAAMVGYAWLFLVEKAIEGVDEKLVITLAVWASAVILYEFTPRAPEPEE